MTYREPLTRKIRRFLWWHTIGRLPAWCDRGHWVQRRDLGVYDGLRICDSCAYYESLNMDLPWKW